MAWKGITLDTIPVLTAPNGGKISPYILKNTPISGDRVEGTYLHMTSPRVGWVNAGGIQQFVKWETVTVVPPPPPPTKAVTNIIHVYDDGSIDVAPQ